MLLSEAITHSSNQWGQRTISLIRRQRRVRPGWCRWRADRVLVERKEDAEKVGGDVGFCIWGGAGFHIMAR